MVKTIRVSDTTYQYIMEIVSDEQRKERKKISIDEALQEFITNKKMTFKKDPKAWEKFIALRFHGGKEHDCLDVDSAV